MKITRNNKILLILVAIILVGIGFYFKNSNRNKEILLKQDQVLQELLQEQQAATSSSTDQGAIASTSTNQIESATTTKVETTKKPSGNTLAVLATRTNEEWKKVLTPRQYSTLREGGTDLPFTSDLLHEKRKGSYVTADCGELVFRSEQKFDSGTGWPSFYAPAKPGAVVTKPDNSIPSFPRTELSSPVCKSHLGHVFNDAPQTPTGLRYCINGSALRFIPDAVQ